MADQSDVEAALLAAVEAVRVAVNATWSLRRGWPSAAEQDAAARSGTVLVTVAPRVGFTRNTTRFPDIEVELPRLAPTLTVSVAGSVATFAGTCTPDEIAGVQAGTVAWVVRCAGTDTPVTIAAALASASGGVAAGAVLMLPGLVAARTGRDGATLRPTRQIEQGFQACIWCADPGSRDAAASVIDAGLSDLNFLPLADGSFGRLKYAGTMTSDKAENANLYRRDLFVSVDYSTTIGGTRTPVLFPGATYAPGSIRVGALAP